MTDSGGLSWEAQEVLQKIKSFNRLPGAGIPLIQLNMRGELAEQARLTFFRCESTRARVAGRVVSSLSSVRSDPRAPPAPRGRRFSF